MNGFKRLSDMMVPAVTFSLVSNPAFDIAHQDRANELEQYLRGISVMLKEDRKNAYERSAELLKIAKEDGATYGIMMSSSIDKSVTITIVFPSEVNKNRFVQDYNYLVEHIGKNSGFAK